MSWSCLPVNLNIYSGSDATEFAAIQIFCFCSTAFCDSLNQYIEISDKLKIALFFNKIGH